MNRQEILSRIAKAEEELTKAKEALKLVDKIRWKPERDQSYYAISGDAVTTFTNDDDWVDEGLYAIGNMFETKKEAEHALERLKIRVELLDAGGREKWDIQGDNYRIVYDVFEAEVTSSLVMRSPVIYGIYFNSRKNAEYAIDKVGRYRIKKYLFGE